MSERNWQAGIGAGSSGDVIELQSGGMIDYISVNPRNIFFQWISDFGVGGGVLLVVFAVSIAQLLRKTDRRLTAGLGVAWLFIFYASLWDVWFGTAMSASGNALVGCLLGITLLCPIAAPEDFAKKDHLRDRNYTSASLDVLPK